MPKRKRAELSAELLKSLMNLRQADAAQQLGVSPSTIRRRLTELKLHWPRTDKQREQRCQDGDSEDLSPGNTPKKRKTSDPNNEDDSGEMKEAKFPGIVHGNQQNMGHFNIHTGEEGHEHSERPQTDRIDPQFSNIEGNTYPGSSGSSVLNSAESFQMSGMYDFPPYAQRNPPRPDTRQDFQPSMGSYPMNGLNHLQDIENQKMAHMHLAGIREPTVSSTPTGGSRWTPQHGTSNYPIPYSPPLQMPPFQPISTPTGSVNSVGSVSGVPMSVGNVSGLPWMNPSQDQAQLPFQGIHLGANDFFYELPGNGNNEETLIVTRLSYLQRLIFSLSEAQSTLAKYEGMLHENHIESSFHPHTTAMHPQGDSLQPPSSLGIHPQTIYGGSHTSQDNNMNQARHISELIPNGIEES